MEDDLQFKATHHSTAAQMTITKNNDVRKAHIRTHDYHPSQISMDYGCINVNPDVKLLIAGIYENRTSKLLYCENRRLQITKDTLYKNELGIYNLPQRCYRALTPTSRHSCE